MDSGAFRDSLQPALLDRLRDDDPANAHETASSRVVTKETLRKYILRDLEWLMNCEQPLSLSKTSQYPEVRESVLNFGMPIFSGKTATSVDFNEICTTLKKSILAFEPRLIAETIEIDLIEFDSLLDLHNTVSMQIKAMMWAQPYPIELLLKTSVDLETGSISIADFRR